MQIMGIQEMTTDTLIKSPDFNPNLSCAGCRYDSTAKASISRYLQMNTNIVKGVRCEREGRCLRLYPQEKQG